MTVVLIGVLFVVLGTIAYVALRNAQDFSDANEIIPGVPTNAPKEWAGAHSPEARLHRRLRDAMTALRANRSLDDPSVTDARTSLEREALAVDDRLVAVAALPGKYKDEQLRTVGNAVDAVEAAVADVVALRGPSAGDLERGLQQILTRLALVEEARRELDSMSGASALGELRELREQLQIPDDDDENEEEDEGTEPSEG